MYADLRQMLTDLDGNPITLPERAAPPATDSNAEARLPQMALQESSTSGGASSVPVETAYNRFIRNRTAADRVLKKAQADDQMVERILRRLDMLDAFISDDENMWEKLQKASLRDLAIFEGVYVDKLQALRGQATQVISIQHQEKLDQVLPLLMQVMQQRGLTMTATETKRQVEVTT